MVGPGCVQEVSAALRLTLKMRHFFCVALLVVLLPSLVKAAPVPSPIMGDLCLLPALSKSFLYYQQLAAEGGWPQVPVGPTLREGDQSERIYSLRERLVASNDLAASESSGGHFDTILKQAVQKFQSRHGLTVDGVVGPKTLAELNVPIEDRVSQLSASLQRCQPLPQILENRHILVNIADFSLKLFENGKLVLSMPVIVGKSYRQTPVFSGRVDTLVINPSWNVPNSIATQDILPKVQKNIGYLRQMNFRVLRSWKAKTEIDPATIDWKNFSSSRFPYQLRQDPGPSNALGRVKFLFPNPYDVYMHDTPARELFRKNSRTFSSGCIRLAKPLDLAIYLLQGKPLGSLDALNEAIVSGETRSVSIPSPIAVHIVYMTAWVDHEGIVQFRPDIYNRN